MVSQALFTSNSDEWYTPEAFFKECEKEVWKFDLDPCCTPETKKWEKFFTKENDWLSQEWFWNVFVNPPYSNISKWVEKCSRERESIIYLSTHTSSHRYSIFSRLSVQKRMSRTSLHKRTSKILMIEKFSSFSISTRSFYK